MPRTWDEIEEDASGRLASVADNWVAHPYRKVAKWALILLVAVPIVAGIGHFVFGWFSAGAEIVSPQHVKQVYAVTFDDYKALEASAQNACTLSAAVQSENDPSIRSQRQTQLIATEQNYNRIKADYDAETANIFEANKVRPAQLPLVAPTLTDMEAQVC